MATSRSGSKSTTRAARLRPVGLMTVVPWVPATTWALVSTRPGPTGKPLPKTMPPQPRPRIFKVSEAAAWMPAVLTESGSGSGDGATGSSPAKAAGKLTPAMIASTRARKAGGLGNTESRVRRMADRWMALATRVRGTPLQPQPQKPGDGEQCQRRENGASETVDPAALGVGEQSKSDRFADPVADAAAHRAEHDQDQQRPQRLYRRVGDVERVHQDGRQGGADDDTDDETGILSQREPEAAAIAAADGDDERHQDDEIDDGEAHLGVDSKIASRFTDADERVAFRQLFVTDQPRIGLVDDAIDFDHARLAATFLAIEGKRKAGPQPGSKNPFFLRHVDRLPALDEGDMEEPLQQRLLIAVMMR